MDINTGSSDAHSQLVKLNVGVKKFVTTQQTLRSKGENFLTALLDNIASGKITCVYDEQGLFHVCDNTHFVDTFS